MFSISWVSSSVNRSEIPVKLGLWRQGELVLVESMIIEYLRNEIHDWGSSCSITQWRYISRCSLPPLSCVIHDYIFLLQAYMTFSWLIVPSLIITSSTYKNVWFSSVNISPLLVVLLLFQLQLESRSWLQSLPYYYHHYTVTVVTTTIIVLMFYYYY